MSVDLPSSTEPHVTRRRSSACCACSEIADTLAVLHRSFREAVVGPRFAALRPVGDREHADVLALAHARVVDVPQLGPLGARVPLPEVVAEREDALLRPGALLVAPRTADRSVELMLLDRVEERRRLQAVPRR